MIVRTIYGSHLYGLAGPKSDKDYKSVFMPTMQQVLLGRIPRTQRLSSGDPLNKNTSTDIDDDSYSLHYFLELAHQGQSVALDMLHGDKEEEFTEEWMYLKRNRHMFYTKSMTAFVGYARKQAAKYGIKGSRLSAVAEGLRILLAHPRLTIVELTRDKSIIPETEFSYVDYENGWWELCGKKMSFGSLCSEYIPMLMKYHSNYGKRALLALTNEGLDWKAISHALRVGYQTKAIFLYNEFYYPLRETNFLMDVKNGRLNYTKKVAPILDALMEELEELSKASQLPEKTNRLFWDQWLLERTGRSLWIGKDILRKLSSSEGATA